MDIPKFQKYWFSDKWIKKRVADFFFSSIVWKFTYVGSSAKETSAQEKKLKKTMVSQKWGLRQGP